MKLDKIFKNAEDQVQTDAVWKSLSLSQKKSLLVKVYGRGWRKKFLPLIKEYENMLDGQFNSYSDRTEEGLGYWG